MKNNLDLRKTAVQEMPFVLRILGERSIEMQTDIHIAFIDYEKAFHRVEHEVLMKDLKALGIDEKDLRLLNNLYKEQIAAISINGDLSEWAQIKRGVRQGCVLSRTYSHCMQKTLCAESSKLRVSRLMAHRRTTYNMRTTQC